MRVKYFLQQNDFIAKVTFILFIDSNFIFILFTVLSQFLEWGALRKDSIQHNLFNYDSNIAKDFSLY